MASLARKSVGWTLFLGAALALSYNASQFAIDLSVYHPIARYLFGEDGAIYGEPSGLPWPMWYRYPPLFLFLFWPISLLSFPQAAFVWTFGKCLALAAMALALVRRCPLSPTAAAWLGAAVLAGPYIYTEFRYANAQFFVFALVAGALLWGERRPWMASSFLGLAAALKVWPLFFVPYAFVAGQRRMALAAIPWAALYSVLPGFYFGWAEYQSRLLAWWGQETAIVERSAVMWFPSQSLYGLLTRLLTRIDYSSLPDANYATVHIAELESAQVTYLWLGAIALVYGLLLWVAWKAAPERKLAAHGAAFCALVLLQPYAQKQTALVVLAWPAIVAAGYVSTGAARRALYLFTAAATLSLIQPLLGGYQRWFLVIGLDTLIVALTFACMAVLATGERESYEWV